MNTSTEISPEKTTIMPQAVTFPDDLLNVKKYTLSNGLTVLMSVNKAEPRVQVFVAVRAGSKSDPSDHTGLAHYLEHMMFKGTDRFGTKDYSKEEPYLREIDNLYEVYNHTTDEEKRKEIYRQIDTVSGEAAKYAIPNEYDKMMQSLGASGTNAFTWTEQTVYINNIPSNQLSNWMTAEAERFRHPVFRIFHTELEAVYEEKNRALDNDDVKVDEAMMAGLFSRHPYGTQTTIGTVEHLKNPSLKKIREYFDTYYVPNNMAIILVGDLDPEESIAEIQQHFSGFEARPIPPFTFVPEEPRQAPVEKTVLGPNAAEVSVGFRFPGAGTQDALLLRFATMMLYNDKAGLIDLDLVKKQKVLEAGAFYVSWKDYSYQLLHAKPAEGQSLEQARDLLLEQIEKLKKGEFEEELVTAVINNIKVDEIRRQESNQARGYEILDAFITGREWSKVIEEKKALRQVTKEQIVAFANAWYGNDYVVVYKRVGEDKSVIKVEKPPITQVQINRNDISEFAEKIISAHAGEVQPVFLDYKHDILHLQLSRDLPLYYLKNKENQRFSLYYVLDMGRNNNKKLPLAVNYLEFVGTDKFSAEEISRKFYALGCSFGISAGNEKTYIYLFGLQENFEPAVMLLEELLQHAKPDQQALDMMTANQVQARENQKKDKNIILQKAMVSYAKYGPVNPFNHVLKNEELALLNAGELTNYLKSLTSYCHKVYYYGPQEENKLRDSLMQLHKTPENLLPYPEDIRPSATTISKNRIFFVDYDMVQANIFWVAKGGSYDPDSMPVVAMFNEYFGGGMGSIVFQTLRESKALAYSTYSRYEVPTRRQDPFFITAFIGTQADKLREAVTGMNELLTDMPETEVLFENARKGLHTKIAAQRILRQDILLDYDQAQKLGLDYDIRYRIYHGIPKLSLADLQEFHRQFYSGTPYTYLVLASKDRLDMTELAKYGEVQFLSLEEIFGY